MSDVLTEFLSARLDEDEAAAKAAAGQFAQPVWILRDHPSESVMVRDEGGSAVVYDEGVPNDDQAAHIARHDPARVLREVAATRQLIADYEQALQGGRRHDRVIASVLFLQLTTRADAWLDHPDYRDEWASGRIAQ